MCSLDATARDLRKILVICANAYTPDLSLTWRPGFTAFLPHESRPAKVEVKGGSRSHHLWIHIGQTYDNLLEALGIKLERLGHSHENAPLQLRVLWNGENFEVLNVAA